MVVKTLGEDSGSTQKSQTRRMFEGRQERGSRLVMSLGEESEEEDRCCQGAASRAGEIMKCGLAAGSSLTAARSALSCSVGVK